MKNAKLIIGLFIVIAFTACGNADSSDSSNNNEEKSQKSGIYEPTTQAELVEILNNLNIKPYSNAVVDTFYCAEDAVLEYKVSSKNSTNKEIADYYKKAFNEAFKDNSDWVYHDLIPNISFYYAKKMDDLKMTFSLTHPKAQFEIKGGDPQMYENVKDWKFSIQLGDGAMSY